LDNKGQPSPRRILYYTDGPISKLKPEDNAVYAARIANTKDPKLGVRSPSPKKKAPTMQRENLDLQNELDANEFINKSRENSFTSMRNLLFKAKCASKSPINVKRMNTLRKPNVSKRATNMSSLSS